MPDVFHLILGWSCIGAGLLMGACLGVAFLRDDFLGGYGSRRRRLVRLAHIALVALGAINILFAVTLQQATLGVGASAGLALPRQIRPYTLFRSSSRNSFINSCTFGTPAKFKRVMKAILRCGDGSSRRTARSSELPPSN